MEYKDFKKVIENIEHSHNNCLKAYDLNINLFEFDNKLLNSIDILLKSIYGEHGYDWIAWYCWENDFGKGGLDADDNGGPICYSLKSLWEYVEANHKI